MEIWFISKDLQRCQRQNPSNPQDADLPSSQRLGPLAKGATLSGAPQTSDISADQRQ